MTQGTPDFWSIEVEWAAYLRLSDNSDCQDLTADSTQNWDPELELALMPKTVFQHNVLHDIESVFWVSLWTMLYLVGPEDVDNGQIDTNRKHLYAVMFQRDSVLRKDFMDRQERRTQILDKYSSGIRNETLRTVVSNAHFNRMPKTLKGAFTNAQKDLPGTLIPYECPAFSETLLTWEVLLMRLDTCMGTFGEFPVQPLQTHKHILAPEPLPKDLERWEDAHENTDASHDQADDHLDLSSGSRQSRKRQKMEDFTNKLD
jgi:hypothetical protein